MCNPIAFAAAQAAVATTRQGVSVFTDIQRARQTKERSEKTFAENVRLTGIAARQNLNQLGLQRQQQAAAAARSRERVRREARNAVGAARAAAARTGTAGASVAALTEDFLREQANAEAAIIRNERFADAAFEASSRAIRLRQEATNFANLPAPVEFPSFLGAALRIGVGGASSGIQGFSQGQEIFGGE